MTSKETVAKVQANKNHWYQNAKRGVIGPVLPRPIKKG